MLRLHSGLAASMSLSSFEKGFEALAFEPTVSPKLLRARKAAAIAAEEETAKNQAAEKAAIAMMRALAPAAAPTVSCKPVPTAAPLLRRTLSFTSRSLSFKRIRRSLSFTTKKTLVVLPAAVPDVPASPSTVIEVPTAADPKMASVDTEVAAVKVQAAQRGRAGRMQVANQMRTKKMVELEDAQRAKKATKLQAVQRGRSVRAHQEAAASVTTVSIERGLKTWEVVLAMLTVVVPVFAQLYVMMQ